MATNGCRPTSQYLSLNKANILRQINIVSDTNMVSVYPGVDNWVPTTYTELYLQFGSSLHHLTKTNETNNSFNLLQNSNVVYV